MKLKNLRILLAAALLVGLTACTDSGKDTETQAPTGTVAESVTQTEQTATEETDPETPAETVPETPAETQPETIPETEPETLPVLEWETYDSALDNSTVNTGDEHVVDQSQWIVTDGLDRVMVTNTQTGDKREDKIVAIFYWTWHGQFANEGQKAYNNQENIDKLIAMGKTERDYVTASISDLNKWGIKTASGPYHFWDEPIYGYYSANDEWVIRKQAELLAAADVDVVFFDNTNGTFTWMESAKRVMKVFSEARAQGVDAPTVSFMLPFAANSDTRTQLIQLYNQIYKENYYPDSWFRMDGKPMLMAHSAALNGGTETDRIISDFFTFRASVADYLQQETTANQWGWLSRFPQAYFHDSNGNVEQITVGTAINHDYVNRVIAPMSLGQNVIGRTWTSYGYDTRENAIFYGACFAEQWENALSVDPEVVFVTAWNEWVAMRIGHWPAASGYSNCFVDQYNAEFSRDCEPSAGILKDYYYYQLADYIRQYKGTNPIEAASDPKLIDVNGGYGQWANVGPVYNDYFGLPDRNAYGYTDPETNKKLHYTNDTGRNDVYDAKVARDYENIYFMVRTVDALTPYTDAHWMNLYIDMGESGDTNWENYEFILNKQNPENETTAILEKFTGNGYETEVVGKVTYAVKGNVLTVCIPKTMLGIDAEDMEFEFGFKWTDNTLVGDDGDIMKWYLNGDVAPVGRFNYCYTTEGSAEHVDEGLGGNYSLDLTDADTQKLFQDYILSANSSGVEVEFVAEGLKFTTTAEGTDARLILDYGKLSPQVVLDNCTALNITYRVLTDVTEMRVGVASATDSKGFQPARAGKVTLVADGESHVTTLKTSTVRANEGYADEVGFTFAKGAAAGQTIVIEKLEFVFEDKTAE